METHQRGKEANVIGLLLVALLLVLLFGGLGVAISPLFFILIAVVLIAALFGGSRYRSSY
jgi:hypothetical protein